MIKVFVGTMYTIENEIQECINSILKQKNVEIDHAIVSNLPEKEAHNRLWDHWHSRMNDFDLFVKVDADTVVRSDHAFEVAYNLIKEKNATGIQAPLLDHLSSNLINGLNFFSTKVSFNVSTSDLYCDRVDIGNTHILREYLPDELRPAGDHCPNPSNIQAFHYGLHRQLKNQTRVIGDVYKSFAANFTEPKMWAIIGSMYASEYKDHIGFNYSDKKFNDLFNHALSNIDSLREKLK